MICEEEVQQWLGVVGQKGREFDHAHYKQVFGDLEDLTGFLKELKQFIDTKGNPRAVLQQIPSVAKLLGTLSQNCIVQCSENAVRVLFQCIVALATCNTEHNIDRTTNKTITWTQSQIRLMTSPSPACPHSILVLGQFLGSTATELTQKMTEKTIHSICHDLLKHQGIKWNLLKNDFVPSLAHRGLVIRTLSDMCLPVVYNPVARSLVEALLVTGNSSTDLIGSSTAAKNYNIIDCLSLKFLDAVTELTRHLDLNPETEGCGVHVKLSYHSLVSLWRRYQPSFECQIFDVLEASVLRHTNAHKKNIMQMIKSSYLARACADYTDLHIVALQIIYAFVRSAPNNARLRLFLDAFKESCLEVGH